MLASVEAADVEAGRIAGVVGRVVIGFTGAATYELLPSLAMVLRQEMPGIELDLKGEMLTPLQVAMLVEETLDIGFRRRRSGTAGWWSGCCVVSR